MAENSKNLNEQKLIGTIDNLAFIDTLVCAITGHHIAQLPTEKRNEIVASCNKVFNDFIFEYTSENFGLKIALRLKAAQIYNINQIFNKFPDLKNQYDQAYRAFVAMLEDQN